MYMLDSARAELHYFLTPEAVLEKYYKYAILSHVWDKEEQSFKDVKKIAKRCTKTGTNPRDDPQLSEKVRRCCILAEQHGYQWVWIDTCCIDKSSSTELSEAINSMYRYYSLSGVCYAYLRDVSTPKRVSLPIVSSNFNRWRLLLFLQEFGHSMWWSRGWTLQELIAPGLVLFLSESWEIIGSKYDLSELVTAACSVPGYVLRHERDLSDVSVAQRMSWAAPRKTTRVEDEAYCLLGIFNINMPTLYGEGKKAFQRLQQEIVKMATDLTIFAWGICADRRMDVANFSLVGCDLLASSPSDFSECGSYECVFPHWQELESMAGHFAQFDFTPHVVRAHIPVLNIGGEQFMDLCCVNEDNDPLFLRLVQDTSSRRPGIYGSKTRVGGYRWQDRYPSFRCVELYTTEYRSHKPSWLNINFMNTTPSEHVPNISKLPMNHRLSTKVYFPSWYQLIQLTNDVIEFAGIDTTSGDLPVVITFLSQRRPGIDERMLVELTVGICHANATHSWTTGVTRTSLDSTRSNVPEELLSLWITLKPASPITSRCARYSHNCATDHVCGWNNLEKKFLTLCRPRPAPFTDVYSAVYILPNTVHVTLTPGPFNPSETLSLNFSMSSMSSEDIYSLAKMYMENPPQHVTDMEHLPDPDPDPNHLPTLPISGFRLYLPGTTWARPLDPDTYGTSGSFGMIKDNQLYYLGTDANTSPSITSKGNTVVFDRGSGKFFAYHSEEMRGLELLAYDERVMEWVPTFYGRVSLARHPVSAGCGDNSRALYYALGELNGMSVVGVTAEYMRGTNYKVLCWKTRR
ncbi:heterokaryon incompatibility protein-domain-containing protein [Earliella scabrosa]|nr:heterokaryon incompatibility protein-domain-containing protein [Earliella scabrosa]